MLWYGQTSITNTIVPKRRKQARRKQTTNLTNLPPRTSNSEYIAKVHFLVPSFWTFALLANPRIGTAVRRAIFLSQEVYFFKIPLPLGVSGLTFCDWTRALAMFIPFSQPLTSSFLVRVSNFLFLASRPLFIKMKFKGKGYYAFRNYRQVLAPQFGFSHRRYFYNFSTKIKFLAKTIILFFGLMRADISLVTKSFFFYKPINVFTGRGVRFSKQVIYRKTGKVSSYR